jgi:hypothetical protein
MSSKDCDIAAICVLIFFGCCMVGLFVGLLAGFLQ